MSSAPLRDLDWGDVLYFTKEGEPLSPEARKLAGLQPLAAPDGKRWVEVLDVELDYLALVDGYLAQCERGHLPKASAYWNKRVELLERLLGFSLGGAAVSPALEARVAATSCQTGRNADRGAAWSDPRATDVVNQPERIAQELRRTALQSIDLHARITDPFGGRLEGVPHPLVREIEGRRRPAFKAIDRELRDACRELVAEVVRTLDPDVVGRRVRKSQLFDLGLDWWEADSLLEGW